MDEILDKSFNEVTEGEWKRLQKALKTLIGSKPSVPFAKATIDDCLRTDGLALDLQFIEPFAVRAPSLRIPADFAAPSASDFLCETLDRIKSIWVLDNEKSCRIL
jgi:hypothetical protein